MKKINVLDCTLRDGGYYNNWDFPKDLVNDYLKAISDSGIKYVELGFRSLKQINLMVQIFLLLIAISKVLVYQKN